MDDQGSKAKAEDATDEVALPINLIKSMNGNVRGEGSSSSNGGGNNSDNSALVSFGNTSFGFNFDSEEGNSPQNSDRNGGSDTGSDGNGAGEVKSEPTVQDRTSAPNLQTQQDTKERLPVSNPRSEAKAMHSAAFKSENTANAADAADVAVSSLQLIANAYKVTENETPPADDTKLAPIAEKKAVNPDNEAGSNGYNSEDECTESQKNDPDDATSVGDISENPGDRELGPDKKKTKLGDKKREERNAREKERSFRISKQINELRALLSNGGVIVPKGTKSSVLTEAANYIRVLQQHQYRSEIDRHHLIQQIQMIGGGAHGPQAAAAIRHVAAQNGVWSLGNFGGVPPRSAMTSYQPGTNMDADETAVEPTQQTKIEDHEYRSVFNKSAVGMAIASMGGAFIDCNQLFCLLSNYTKQEVCSLTIFNLTARQDLQHAFDLISQLISPPLDVREQRRQPVVLRGALKNRNDLGLGLTLVKGDDGVANVFCVTLIKNPASPFDESKPVPATIEMVQGFANGSSQATKDTTVTNLDSAPAFTTG